MRCERELGSDVTSTLYSKFVPSRHVFACGPVIRFGVSASPHSNQEHMHFFHLSGEEMAISWQQMEVQFVARFNPFTQLYQTRRSKNRPCTAPSQLDLRSHMPCDPVVQLVKLNLVSALKPDHLPCRWLFPSSHSQSVY